MGPLQRRAEAIERRTPSDRDRFADLVRVGAILVVVLGHWLVAFVRLDDGELVAAQLLAIEPWTRGATWLAQVMPLFFLVGGKVNAASLGRARDRGLADTTWMRRRARRLLRPLVPLVVVWVALGAALALAGVDVAVIEVAVETALLPLWFLVVYLLVIVLAPATIRLHRRAPLATLTLAVLLVVAVDVLDQRGVPVVGEANYVLVFGVVHQLGYLWSEGRVPGPRRAGWLVVAGLGVALGLVIVLDYPVSMVGIMGAASNATPPNVALLGLALAQLGAVLALEPAGTRLLHRRLVPWAVVAVIGRVIITVFVWHMSALILVASATVLTGWWPQPAEPDATWWALRAPWVVLCVVALLPLVALFARLEGAGRAAGGRPVSTLAGLAVTATGLYLVLTEGPWRPDELVTAPSLGLALVAVGFALLGLLGEPRGVSRRSSRRDGDRPRHPSPGRRRPRR